MFAPRSALRAKLVPKPEQEESAEAKAQEILRELKIDAAPLRSAKARPPPHQESFELPRDDGGVDPQYPDRP